MRTVYRSKAKCLLACCSFAFAGTASAGIPVFDLANDLSNIAQNFQLTLISHQLSDKDEGTVNFYNNQISVHSNNIDNSTTNIDKSTTVIKESTTNIDASTTEINKTTNLNFAIESHFTWIINKNGQEIIPIPAPILEGIEKIKKSGSTDAYLANFKAAESYTSMTDEDRKLTGIEGSRARKAANDMLVRSLDAQVDGLKAEAEGLKMLAEKSNKAQGEGHHLQIANALAGSQIDQTMKLRSMLLASESARAAEALASADKDARAIATGKKLREGLAESLRKVAPRTATY